MSIAIAGLIGAALGALAAWLARADTIGVLRAELERARKAEEVATDRLVHAWKEGAVVPPRPSEPAPPPDPLPGPLLEEINQWEDGEHRAMLEAHFRQEMARGKSVPAILLELDNVHP